SEEIVESSFTAADVTMDSGLSDPASGVVWDIEKVSGTQYLIHAIDATSSGELKPVIASSKVTDFATLGNQASTGSDSVDLNIEPHFIAVCANRRNSACALTAQGDAYCWGENDNGE